LLRDSLSRDSVQNGVTVAVGNKSGKRFFRGCAFFLARFSRLTTRSKRVCRAAAALSGDCATVALLAAYLQITHQSYNLAQVRPPKSNHRPP
jgi:hypothetical protein